MYLNGRWVYLYKCLFNANCATAHLGACASVYLVGKLIRNQCFRSCTSHTASLHCRVGGCHGECVTFKTIRSGCCHAPRATQHTRLSSRLRVDSVCTWIQTPRLSPIHAHPKWTKHNLLILIKRKWLHCIIYPFHICECDWIQQHQLEMDS